MSGKMPIKFTARAHIARIVEYISDLSDLNDLEFDKMYNQLDHFSREKFDARMFYGFTEYEKRDFDDERFKEELERLFMTPLSATDMGEMSSDISYYVKTLVYLIELKRYIEGD